MEERSDHIFNAIVNQAGKSYLDSEDKKPPADIRLILAVLGILIFVGAEGVKTFLRKDFKVTPRGMFRFVLCFLAFGGIAAISFNMINSNDDFATKYGTPQSHLVIGLAYSVTAIYILIIGIMQRIETQKGNQRLTLKGRSYLYEFLKKDGWSERKIQNLAEPLLFIATGTALCFYDLLGGLALAFCGLSVWLMEVVNLFFPEPSIHQTVNRLNSNVTSNESFHEVNS